MIIINVDKNNMQVLSNETITSGSINAYTCKFTFSDDWEGLTKSAVFRAGDKYIECLLSDDDTVSIPWECMTAAGVELFVGLRGVAGEETETKDDDIVLPSVWCLIGTVRKGTTAGEEPEPPTPSAWEQILMKINSLEENKQNVLTAGDNISISYDNVISASAYDDTELRASVDANTEAIAGLETSKQNKLTAGDNITISPEGVISAVVGASYDDTEIRAELSDVKNSVNTNTENIASNSSAISANTEAIAGLETSKQDTLTAGANITISNGVISAVGGASYDDTKVKADIAANSAAIEANSSAISANTEAISGLETSKQDTLTAGANITILPGNVISAASYDDTNLKAQISNVSARVDSNSDSIVTNANNIASLRGSIMTKQDELTAGANITISENNVISAASYNDTELRNLIANKQDALTAGDNITISNGVISSAMYDDTQIKASVLNNFNTIQTLSSGKQDRLTAGANITIENNVISATGGGGSSDDKMNKVNPTGSGLLTITGGSAAIGNECEISSDVSGAYVGGNKCVSGYSNVMIHGSGLSATCLNQAIFGQFNVRNTATNLLVIGNGSGNWLYPPEYDNVFRVTDTGATYADAAYNSSGADYAEYVYEWEDGNAENEDRRGYFVTVKNKKLCKAEAGDYIVGITSGNPSVIGNSDGDDWRGRWVHDELGSVIYNSVTINDYAEDGVTVIGTHTETRKVQSEDYDSSLEYIERKDRPEWSCVGMVGVLHVRDDGTCIPGDFCKCGEGGIATYSSERGFDTFFVLERTGDNIVKVQLR